MKHILILLSIVAILFCSCSAQINKDEIIGTWKVIEFKTVTPTLSLALIEGAKVEALSSTYSFQKNKTFRMKSNIISSGEDGNYEFLSGKIIEMTITSEGHKTKAEYHLELLSGNLMKWTQDMGDLGNLSMTLKKNKN
jgi:hypothetical protein